MCYGLSVYYGLWIMDYVMLMALFGFLFAFTCRMLGPDKPCRILYKKKTILRIQLLHDKKGEAYL